LAVAEAEIITKGKNATDLTPQQQAEIDDIRQTMPIRQIEDPRRALVMPTAEADPIQQAISFATGLDKTRRAERRDAELRPGLRPLLPDDEAGGVGCR
jgi:hypothetical protein